MKKCIALLVSVVFAVAISDSRAPAQETPSRPAPLYDPNSQHLWNRLRDSLWDRVGRDGRVYGNDRVDPLLWSETQHLLPGPSQDAAVRLVQEFLNTHGENLIDDPLKRAMLQRDLWAIFDWLVDPPRGQLYQPLAQVIGRLALDPESIEKLPDTYAAAVASKEFAAKYDAGLPHKPFLPPDLFDPEGPWVCIGRNGSDIVVPAHARGVSRSAFQVFLKLPEGRQATSDYLTALSRFKEPFVLQPSPNDDRFLPHPNPELPQFLAGTQVALVRSAMLIDSGLRLRATRIIESVQLRDDTGNYEFTLNRARLFAGTAGGLRAVAPDERDFHTPFNPLPTDQLEGLAAGADITRQMGVVMRTCVDCHRHGNSLPSFNTFVGGFSPGGRELHPSFFDAKTTARGETAAIRNKQTRYEWGLLEGLLREVRESAPPGR